MARTLDKICKLLKANCDLKNKKNHQRILPFAIIVRRNGTLDAVPDKQTTAYNYTECIKLMQKHMSTALWNQWELIVILSPHYNTMVC